MEKKIRLNCDVTWMGLRLSNITRGDKCAYNLIFIEN